MSSIATPVALGIDTEATFDLPTSLTLLEALPLLAGKRGPPRVEVARRWANPKRGCTVGPHRLVLPSVRIGGVLRTMPAWVKAFNALRVRLGLRQPPTLARPTRTRRADQRQAAEVLRKAGIT